jgi:hypothetical protein
MFRSASAYQHKRRAARSQIECTLGGYASTTTHNDDNITCGY